MNTIDERDDGVPNPPITAAPIEYDRGASRYMTRRQGRVLTALCLLNLVLLGWMFFAPNSSQQLRQQWEKWQQRRAESARLRQAVVQQQQCLDFQLPSGRVIYEEEPAEATKLVINAAAYAPVRVRLNNLLASTAAWQAPAARIDTPPAWVEFANSNCISNGIGCPADVPLVFMGRRTIAATSQERLVVVQLDSRPTFDAGEPASDRGRMNCSRQLIVSTFIPANNDKKAIRQRTEALHLLLPPTWAHTNSAGDTWVVTNPALLTVLAGTTDTSDAAHFTIPYRVNGVEDVIDGWVQTEGTLLKPRMGAQVNFGGSQRAWNLPVPAAPATQLATTRAATNP